MHPHPLLLAGRELVADALGRQLALELGEGQQDVQQHPAHRIGGIELLRDRHERHAMPVEDLHQLGKVVEGAAQSVDLVDDDVERCIKQAKTRNPCGMQGSSGPQRAVVAVDFARVGDVKSKLTKGRYRSVA